jgi:hypothetical protein
MRPRPGLTNSGELATELICESLGVRLVEKQIDCASLPFALGDATAGTENELQAQVSGPANQVDLPVTIRRSQYFANLTKRVATDEAPRQFVRQLERYLTENHVWENSWVRVPRKSLSRFANHVLEQDLHNGHTQRGQRRADSKQFLFPTSWGEWVRVPISYLVKLSLADRLSRQPEMTPALTTTALQLFEHFSNDLTSPETRSFYVVSPAQESLGKSVASEMGVRFLLTHLLIEWANKALGLESLGQKASVHFSPHAPLRQKELNECISDSFYAELFVSPCLCGWEDGQMKHEYMRLCHRTVSRSRINAVLKLRDAGLIPSNRVVLPNTSSVALANNGTHLSLGSKRIKNALISGGPFTAAHEKYIGDLVIKISEHFLPLFVGTYSAAPMRLAFSDLHPELALGFLPHALDYTHLRMLWRHWRRKAHLWFWGQPVSPVGLSWWDTIVSSLFRVSGDLVSDYRLIDFPVAWLCTEGASALDGSIDNVSRLLIDLDAMGVSDRHLKFYMPISLREFGSLGFSGFEGRHYSVFESFEEDFAAAADLQQLITILAFKYVLSGAYEHVNIPDDPLSESERRLPFFYGALGLAAVNVRTKTPNQFLRRVLSLTKTSPSRHRDYLRVRLADYLSALVRLIETDAADIIELLGLHDRLRDLRDRILSSNNRVDHRMVRNITGKHDVASALKMPARDFNLAAETYYRDSLKKRLLSESLRLVLEKYERDANIRGGLYLLLKGLDVPQFLGTIESSLTQDRLTEAELGQLINIVLAVLAMEMDEPAAESIPQHYASA